MESRDGLLDARARRRNAVPASARGRARQLVLVVEDDPDHWEIYGKMLWYNGFDVLYASDGPEGLQLAQEHRPDLVLLDLGLPGMDGVELCRRLKQQAAARDLPVLVLTGLSETEYGEQVRRAGCDGYLEKPQSPVQVLHEVERRIGQAPPGAAGPPPDAGVAGGREAAPRSSPGQHPPADDEGEGQAE